MNRKKIFLLSIFYILLFIGGYFLDRMIIHFSSVKVSTPETIVYNPPPPQPELDKANELNSRYIYGLGFHGDPILGVKSKYLTTKEEIVNAYNRGDRSVNLMRAYIYMLAQEGNFVTKEKIIRELCVQEELCKEFITDILITGVIKTPRGEIIKGATVQVL